MSGATITWYEFIPRNPTGPALTWTAARTAAETMSHLGSPGYLATLTSAGEHSFAVALFSPVVQPSNGPWIGGFQPQGQSSPSSGWQWVTGEPWSYTNFRQGNFGCFGAEPNDGDCLNAPPIEDNEENHLHLQNVIGQWLWNDAPHDFNMPGFIVEFDPSQVQAPEPTSFALLSTGFLIGLGFLRRRS